MPFNNDIITQFNTYRKEQFGNQKHPFDRELDESSDRPPVFSENLNILQKPDVTKEQAQEVVKMLPSKKRHKWFQSMKSSQALAQSVFANLAVYDKLSALSSLTRDDGQPLFVHKSDDGIKCQLEYGVPKRRLNEIAPTEIDVLLTGQMTVAIECKFAEIEVGSCGMVKSKKDKNGSPLDPKCNGDYKKPPGCYLTNKKIKYWEYIPELFNWDAADAYSPCPIILPYQLIRNVLAVCVTDVGNINIENVHAVLLYDKRNKAFQSDGDGMKAWVACKEALKHSHLLQKCTWQQLVAALKQDSELFWLTDALNDKYGIC